MNKLAFYMIAILAACGTPLGAATTPPPENEAELPKTVKTLDCGDGLYLSLCEDSAGNRSYLYHDADGSALAYDEEVLTIDRTYQNFIDGFINPDDEVTPEAFLDELTRFHSVFPDLLVKDLPILQVAFIQRCLYLGDVKQEWDPGVPLPLQMTGSPESQPAEESGPARFIVALSARIPELVPPFIDSLVECLLAQCSLPVSTSGVLFSDWEQALNQEIGMAAGALDTIRHLFEAMPGMRNTIYAALISAGLLNEAPPEESAAATDPTAGAGAGSEEAASYQGPAARHPRLAAKLVQTIQALAEIEQTPPTEA